MPKSPTRKTGDLSLVSSDAFKSWQKCRKQFYYKHIARLNWPSDTRHFSLGQDVHKLLDYQARRLPDEAMALLLQNAAQNVRVSYEKLLAHPLTRLPVIANEWGFHVPVGPDWLVGRIDRVARDGDNVLVIDWKTGTGVPRDAENDWQTILYLYAVVELANAPGSESLGLAGLRPEQVRFEYVEVKADPEIPVRLVTIPYDSQKHEAAGERIRAVLSAMSREDRYDITTPCPDRFCAYRPICGIEQQS